MLNFCTCISEKRAKLTGMKKCQSKKETKRKVHFPFVFRSLNRTFAEEMGIFTS